MSDQITVCFEVIAQSFTTSGRIKKIFRAPTAVEAHRLASIEVQDYGYVTSIKQKPIE